MASPNLSTTVTLLTPLTPAALAAVRVFGPAASDLLERLTAGQQHRTRDAALVRVVDPHNHEPIDQAIIRRLPGTDGFELTLHGGVRIAQRVLTACEALGATRLDPNRQADRDELWRQSLLLARADGVARPALWADVELALPRVRTRAGADWLVGQWSEGLGRRIEDAIAGPQQDRQVSELAAALLADYPARTRALHGVRIAIVGPANAGKSTLFNRLLGQQAAIVSDQPGTTRDYVCQWANLSGVPAELLDTAGLHELAGELENAAAAAAAPLTASADIRLIILDATSQPTQAELADFARLAGIGLSVWLLNKSDCAPAWDPRQSGISRAMAVSATTGEGLDSAVSAIVRELALPDMHPDRPGIFADRQQSLLLRAVGAAGAANNLLQELLNGL